MREKDDIHKILRDIIDNYKGPLSQEVLNRLAAEAMGKMNQQATPEAEELNPDQLHNLLYSLFSNRSIVKHNLTPDLDLAMKSPMLNLCIDLLGIIQRENGIKQTKTGALPVKVVQELYGKKYIREFVCGTEQKVRLEKDSISISLAKILCRIIGYVRVYQGKLCITKKGKAILDDPAKMLVVLFEVFIYRFNWGYFDLYASEEIGKFGVGITLFLLNKYGDQEHEARFYSNKFIQVFPDVLNKIPDHEPDASSFFYYCYSLRTFERGLNWFGLVDIRNEKSDSSYHWTIHVKKTQLFDELIKVEDPGFKPE